MDPSCLSATIPMDILITFVGFCLFLIYISDSKHSHKDIFMTDTFWGEYIENWKLVLVNSCSEMNIEDHRILLYSICVKSTT